MIRPLGMIGLAVLLLQGCAEVPWTFGDGQEPAVSKPAEPPAEAVTVVENPPPPPRKPTETAVLPEGEAAGTVPEPDVPDVETLLGLDFVAVRDLLGDPALEEIQAPATVWAYNGRGCVLSVFFYPHVDGGEYRALTYDVKGGEEVPELPQRCFSELLRDRMKAEVN